jgi:hypothetical protein
MRRILFGIRLAFLASVLMVCAGCYSTWDIAPKSLTALDGFHEPEARPLADMAGDEVKFDSNTELHFMDSSGAPKNVKFATIAVSGTSLTGTTKPFNYPFAIDLRQVSEAQIKKFSWGKTALLVGIIIAAVVVTPIVLGIVFGTQDNGGS